MVTPPFTISRGRTSSSALRVVLTGEFDMSIGDALSRALLDAVRTPDVTHILVDLEQTTFIDSHVVAALVAGYEAALAARRGFTVVNGRGAVQKVLDVTGLSELLCT